MKVPQAKKLPSGAWRVQVMVDGKRVSITEDDPKVAVAKAAAIKAKMMEAKKAPKDMTLEEAVDRYIESKDTVLSPETIAGYKRTKANQMKTIVSVKLSDMTQERVQKWVNTLSRDKAPKTVRNAHALLSAVLAEYKPEMVLRTTLPQKRRYDAAIPTEDDIKKILAQAKDTPDEILILLAVWLGLRMSEIRGLKWKDIDGDTLKIRRAMVDEGEKTTKSFTSQRDLHIPPRLAKLFEEAPKDSEYIISGLGRHGIYARFQKICEEAGVSQHYRFHDTRHINASVMLALNVPDKYATERMGHSTNHMLKTVYQHTMKSEQEKISEKIDAYFESLTEPEATPE